MEIRENSPIDSSCFNDVEREDLSSFFELSQSVEWDFVIFLARRSYVLATLMGEAKKTELEKNGHTVYLTDAAFLLRCSQLADYYRDNHVFQKILICDDIFIHGRSFNHFLAVLEETLCGLLKEYDSEIVKDDFANAVTIYACYKSDQPILLIGRYRPRFKYIKKLSARMWRNTSTAITNFIANNNSAYAVYIYSAYVSQHQMDEIRNNNKELCKRKTEYQNSTEYTMVDFVGSDTAVKAILTLRFKENRIEKGYRVIPFVFLPELSGNVTKEISEKIVSKMPADFTAYRWLKEWKNFWGKRSYNELITLILSNTILQDFSDKNNIIFNVNEKAKEIKKIARNYNQSTLEQTEKAILQLIDYKFFELEDLKSFLNDTIPDNEAILIRNESSGKIEKNISSIIDEYFYSLGVEEEKSAVEMCSMGYLPTGAATHRGVRDSGTIMKELFNDYAEDTMKDGIRYFLQMMDAGIIAISSYASNNMNVAGFAQFAKNGEQSLLIKPLKMYEYMPMLDLMWRKCIQWGWKIKEELTNFYNSQYWGERTGDEELENIKDFIANLQELGQEPADWCGNFMERIPKIENDDDGNPVNKRSKIISNQYSRLAGYLQYLSLRNL